MASNPHFRRNTWSRIKRSFVFHILLASVAAVLGYGLIDVMRQASFLSKESKSAEEKVKELTQKKQELEVYLRELETREALEREAKARLNLKKPGENVVVVVPDKKSEEVPREVPQDFWERAKNFLYSLWK